MSSLMLIKILLLLFSLVKATSLDHNNTLLFCSMNQTKNNDADKAQFEAILETLFLQLRVELKLESHHGFSSGEIEYGNGTKVFALLYCVQSLSIEECQECVEKGSTKVYENCGGKYGRYAFSKNCTVRYENYRFFSTIGDSNGRSVSGNESRYFKKWVDNNGGDTGFKLKVALAWVIGAVCLGLFVIGAWALRRSIVNTSRVDSCSGVYDGEKGIE